MDDFTKPRFLGRQTFLAVYVVIRIFKAILRSHLNFNFNDISCQNPLGRHLDKGIRFCLIRKNKHVYTLYSS